ncbi:hypothetical protein SAMN05216588_104263 [Pseudomonas flavescens]|uniref:YqjK-like protein n=1 Tax=Phytopseudomonas flavescens TaxID=29435 RepID=A0A1G8C431_9GAMM|nr:hypothetical protein [Pseudomonas flavescens]SDH40241.1 hypothetical protein SAMN05216588_104263 [Pseudomonas flavescens]
MIRPSGKTSTQELRKTMLRLRLEMHRQEIRHEAMVILEPVQKAKDFGNHWRQELKGSNAPIWITGGVFALTFLGMRGGSWRRWLRLALESFPSLRKRPAPSEGKKPAKAPENH